MENIDKFLFLFFAIAVLVTGCAGTTTTGSSSGDSSGAIAGADAKSGSGDAKGALSGLLKNKATTFMVSYEMTGAGEAMSMTMYSKGGKFRYDTSVEGQEGSLFFIDNTVFSCSGEPVMCVMFGEGEAPSMGTEDIEDDLESYKITSKPSRTIAGKTAKCFGVSSMDADVEICYSNEGIPLYSKTTVEGQAMVEMKATKYSTSVADSVFELPAEPQDISAMMAQYQIEG